MDDLLIEQLAQFRWDPLGYAHWAYPWGEPGPLLNERLRSWQEDMLGEIGHSLQSDPCRPVRAGRGSGHGIGKSAEAGILTDWAFNTAPLTKGVVTANTDTQLKTKTWVEIAKWNNLSIANPLNELRATTLYSRDLEFQRQWRIDIVPWSENNVEAFAGLHNKDRRVFLLFDEASTIHDLIWETAEGAMTDEDTEIIHIVFGNPTRNTGRFRECFPDGKFGRRWNFKSIDSRDVEGTNKELFEEWRQDYGEDSDFFKVRVRGIPPDADGDSFISRVEAVQATIRSVPENDAGDVILGVDCARFGGDLSVIYPRRGRDARSLAPMVYSGLDTVALTAMVRDAIIKYQPAIVAIDEGNIGAAVIDNLRYMNMPCLVLGVNFGAGPDGYAEAEVLNKRAEIWWMMRQWLRSGGVIPEHLPGMADRTFIDELTAPHSGYASKVKGRSDAIQLESKKDIKRRLGFSPDFADALACTFTFPMPSMPAGTSRPVAGRVEPDYEPLALPGPAAPLVINRPGRLVQITGDSTWAS